jgi:hypothetical protein
MYASSFAQQIGSFGAGFLPGVDVPADRLARIATRRAFVEMKQRFMLAVSRIAGAHGEDLRERVRRTQEPIELWLLRGAVFAELSMDQHDSRRERLDLRQALDTAFPNSGDLTEPSRLTIVQ